MGFAAPGPPAPRKKRAPAGVGEPRLQAQGMVHQRQDGAPAGRDERRRHGPIGEPVDDQDGAGSTARKSPLRFGQIGSVGYGNEPGSARCRTGRRTAQAGRGRGGRRHSRRSAGRYRPEWRARPGSWCAVVANSANGEWPRANGPLHHSPLTIRHSPSTHAYTGPSNQARARSVSCRVTRMLGERLAVLAQRARPGGLGHGVEDVAAEELGGGEPALELRQRVEVLVGRAA